MKKTILLFAVIAIATLVGLNSCNKGDVTVDPSTDMMVSQVLTDDVMPAFDANLVEVFGSVDEEINCYPDFNQDRRGDMGRMRDRMKDRLGYGFKMRDLFHRLQLTEEQRTQLHDVMVAYHDCVKAIMERTEAQRREILAKAAEARRVAIAEFKAGTNPDNDTRAELGVIIKGINQTAREELQALVDHDALCDCFRTMLRSVYGILDENQQLLFDEWLKKLNHPCLGENFNIEE